MSRRQMRRHARRHPALVIAAGTIAIVTADVVLHVLGLVVIAVAVGAACYWLGLHARPVTRARLAVDPKSAAEHAQLERIILAQRAQLDELEELTGKTTDELLATYRRVASKYGTAARGGTPQ